MTEELREQIARLRAVAPQLNAATDEAAQVVQAVDRLLGDDMSLGISAEGTDYAQRPGDEDDQLVLTCLAYGRVAGKFRLHVRETTRAKDEWGNWTEVIATEDTPWSSCTREEKLQSFATLPELLGVIAERAFRLTEETAATSQTVLDVIRAIGPADGETTKPPPRTPAGSALEARSTTDASLFRNAVRKMVEADEAGRAESKANRNALIDRASETMPHPRRKRPE